VQMNSVLYRNGALFFGAAFAVVVVGFWPTYYSQPLSLKTTLLEIHGFAMTLWCLTLIGQADLIRTDRRALHRKIGSASYVLAPAVVAIGFVVVRHALDGARDDVFRSSQLAAWLAGDAVLLALWDYRSSRRLGVFAVAFALMAGYQAAIFTIAEQPPWKAFADWFLS